MDSSSGFSRLTRDGSKQHPQSHRIQKERKRRREKKKKRTKERKKKKKKNSRSISDGDNAVDAKTEHGKDSNDVEDGSVRHEGARVGDGVQHAAREEDPRKDNLRKREIWNVRRKRIPSVHPSDSRKDSRCSRSQTYVRSGRCFAA